MADARLEHALAFLPARLVLTRLVKMASRFKLWLPEPPSLN
jgi:hypothetical protein